MSFLHRSSVQCLISALVLLAGIWSTPVFAQSISFVHVTPQGSLAPGDYRMVDIQISRNNYTGNVNFSCVGGLPSGVTCNSPTTNISVAQIRVDAPSNVQLGTFTITVRASGSGISSVNETFQLTIEHPPGINSISLNPTSITVNPGSHQDVSVSITRQSGFTGSVSLSIPDFLPAGVSASFTNPGTGNSGSVRITASSSAQLTSVTVRVRAGSPGIQSRDANLTITTSHPPGINSISLSPSSITVNPGSHQDVSVSITRQSGFTGSVSLSIPDSLPAGVSASFTNPGTGNSGNVRITASSSAQLTSVTVRVRASSPGIASRDANLSITTTHPPGINSISLSPNSITVNPGSHQDVSVSITRQSGFTGSVSLSIPDSLPAGVTASFTNPGTGNSGNVRITASTSAQLTSVTVRVRASATGTASRDANLSMTIGHPPGIDSISLNPSSITVNPGSHQDVTVSITRQSGFTGSVSLSIPDSLPAGVTASFTNPGTGNSGNVRISASSSVQLTSVTVRVRASAAGTASRDANLGITTANPPGISSISLNPSSITVNPGGHQDVSVSITRESGFTGSVSLSIPDSLPTGVTASFTNPGTGNSGNVRITASSSAQLTSVTVRVRASATGTASRDANLSISTSNPPGINSISLHPSLITVNPGTHQDVSVSISRQSGFTSSVSLSIPDSLPAGVTASFTNPGTGNSGNVRITASSSAQLTSVTVRVRASAPDTPSRDANLSVTTANSPGIDSISLTPNSITINPGSHHDVSVSISRQSGFTDSVSLSIPNPLPGGVSASFAHPGSGNSGSVRISASTNAQLVSATLKVRASAEGFEPVETVLAFDVKVEDQGKPNLTVTFVESSTGYISSAEPNALISWQVANIGDRSSGEVKTAIKLSTNPDPRIFDGVLVGNFNILPMPINSEFTIGPMLYDIWSKVPSGEDYYLKAKVDVDGVVDDSDYTNRIQVMSSPIWVSPSEDSYVYIAIGDSYSAGISAGNYDPSTNIDGNRCRRSRDVWSGLNPGGISNEAITLPQNSLRSHVACSGAVTRDFFISHPEFYNEGSQALEVGNADLITFTIGGNDLGFSAVAIKLAKSYWLPLDQAVLNYVQMMAMVQSNLAELPETLQSTFCAVKALAPNDADIVVLGYPRIFGTSLCPLSSLPFAFSPVERAWIRDRVDDLNGIIIDAADFAGIHVAVQEVHDEFEGNLLCDLTNKPSMSGLILSDRNASLHPNRKGQIAYAKALKARLDKGLASNLPSQCGAMTSQQARQILAENQSALPNQIGDLVVESNIHGCSSDQWHINLEETVSISGGGYAPGSLVKLHLITHEVYQDTPWKTVLADSDGRFELLEILPSGIPTGAIQIQAQGDTVSGGFRLLDYFGIANRGPIEDSSGDGIPDICDNCPNHFNPNQLDSDGDGIGNVCDICPFDRQNRLDSEGRCMTHQSCPFGYEPAFGSYGICVPSIPAGTLFKRSGDDYIFASRFENKSNRSSDFVFNVSPSSMVFSDDEVIDFRVQIIHRDGSPIEGAELLVSTGHAGVFSGCVDDQQDTCGIVSDENGLAEFHFSPEQVGNVMFSVFHAEAGTVIGNALVYKSSSPSTVPYATTTGSYSEHDNLSARCIEEFGAGASLADWDVIKAEYTGQASEFAAAIDNQPHSGSQWIQRDGSRWYSDTRHYLYAHHDGHVPGGWAVHDEIDNYTLSLGSWYGDRRALCNLSDNTITVLVLSPDGYSSSTSFPINLVNDLESISGISAEMYMASPLSAIVVDDLLPYDAVVTTNIHPWANLGAAVPVGDALADYLDSGGQVVLHNFALDIPTWSLAGRFMDDGYAPVGLPAEDVYTTASMLIIKPDDPIFQGVNEVQFLGAPGIRLAGQLLANGAELLAEWSDGEPMIARKGGVTSINVPYSITTSDPADSPHWQGDLPKLLGNIIKNHSEPELVARYCGLFGAWNHEESWCEGEYGHDERITLAEASSSTGCGGYYKTYGYYSDEQLVALFISNGHCRASSQSFPVWPPESLEAHCLAHGGTGNYRWKYHTNLNWYGNTVGVQCEVFLTSQ